MLDSNVGIYILKGTAPPVLLARLEDTDSGAIVTSSICLGEMLVKITAAEAPMLDILLRQIEVLPFDEAAARIYGTLPFKRRSFDRLIAAHALALGLTLITANEADFADVPGLKVENWMAA